MALDMKEMEKVLDQVGKDKGIDRKMLVEVLEEAMMTVARKKYGLSRDIEAQYNEDLGEVELFQFMQVVDTVEDSNKEVSLDQAKNYDEEVEVGDSIGVKMDTTYLSRIAAQTAKQVIVQKLRDAERELIFNEFQHRKGEVITGLVRRVDSGAVIVDLGKTEGYMPVKEQIPDEPFNSGDRIQAFLKDVQLTPKGPRIILSRGCSEYLQILFEAEVPEIREGLVEIKGAARDPGVRAKIAVFTKDPDVDPIGACVGVRGSRVQNIIQELKGERIDIVPWDEDISRFVCNSLAPAEIQKVIIDDENRLIEVVVGDSNLSLAIGKRGQNVRLASQLTGWKLDIVSESEQNRKLAEAKFQLSSIEGVSETLAMALYQSGFETAQDVADADPSILKNVPGFEEDEKAVSCVKNAQALIASGALDAVDSEKAEDANSDAGASEQDAQKASEKNEADSKVEADSESSKEAGDMGSLEAKLKAEIEARDKKKSKN